MKIPVLQFNLKDEFFAILFIWEQLIFFQHEQQQMLKLIKLPSKSNQKYKEQKGLIQ